MQISYSEKNIVYGLMPKQFRLSELQSMYESIINRQTDKRNFQIAYAGNWLFKETGKKISPGRIVLPCCISSNQRDRFPLGAIYASTSHPDFFEVARVGEIWKVDYAARAADAKTFGSTQPRTCFNFQ